MAGSTRQRGQQRDGDPRAAWLKLDLRISSSPLTARRVRHRGCCRPDPAARLPIRLEERLQSGQQAPGRQRLQARKVRRPMRYAVSRIPGRPVLGLAASFVVACGGGSGLLTSDQAGSLNSPARPRSLSALSSRAVRPSGQRCLVLRERRGQPALLDQRDATRDQLKQGAATVPRQLRARRTAIRRRPRRPTTSTATTTTTATHTTTTPSTSSTTAPPTPTPPPATTPHGLGYHSYGWRNRRRRPSWRRLRFEQRRGGRQRQRQRTMTPTTTIAGRYRLEGRLGVGGMSTVQLAFDDRLERYVAVKLLAEHLADDPDLRLALPPRGAVGGAAGAPEHRAGLRLRARRAHTTNTSS